jgi:heterodisulfide reductase subunit A-like polyferredoxin
MSKESDAYLTECGFKLSEKNEKARCTHKSHCTICGYCKDHCNSHFMIRDHLDPKRIRTQWSKLGD